MKIKSWFVIAAALSTLTGMSGCFVSHPRPGYEAGRQDGRAEGRAEEQRKEERREERRDDTCIDRDHDGHCERR
jgi:hypothetical protein